jgi:hypothetical protein
MVQLQVVCLRAVIGFTFALCLLVVLVARSTSRPPALRHASFSAPLSHAHDESVLEPVICALPSLDVLQKRCPFLSLQNNSTGRPRDKSLMHCLSLLQETSPCLKTIGQPAIDNAAKIPEVPNAEPVSLRAQVFRIQQTKRSSKTTDESQATLRQRDWQQFPETELGLPSTAVCFSGGGARALTSSVGQMRALLALGVLDNQHVGYLTGVSI